MWLLMRNVLVNQIGGYLSARLFPGSNGRLQEHENWFLKLQESSMRSSSFLVDQFVLRKTWVQVNSTQGMVNRRVSRRLSDTLNGWPGRSCAQFGKLWQAGLLFYVVKSSENQRPWVSDRAYLAVRGSILRLVNFGVSVFAVENYKAK